MCSRIRSYKITEKLSFKRCTGRESKEAEPVAAESPSMSAVHAEATCFVCVDASGGESATELVDSNGPDSLQYESGESSVNMSREFNFSRITEDISISGTGIPMIFTASS